MPLSSASKEWVDASGGSDLLLVLRPDINKLTVIPELWVREPSIIDLPGTFPKRSEYRGNQTLGELGTEAGRSFDQYAKER